MGDGDPGNPFGMADSGAISSNGFDTGILIDILVTALCPPICSKLEMALA